MTRWENLPFDIVYEIFKRLRSADMACLASVNKPMLGVIRPYLYKSPLIWTDRRGSTRPPQFEYTQLLLFARSLSENASLGPSVRTLIIMGQINHIDQVSLIRNMIKLLSSATLLIIDVQINLSDVTEPNLALIEKGAVPQLRCLKVSQCRTHKESTHESIRLTWEEVTQYLRLPELVYTHIDAFESAKAPAESDVQDDWVNRKLKILTLDISPDSIDGLSTVLSRLPELQSLSCRYYHGVEVLSLSALSRALTSGIAKSLTFLCLRHQPKMSLGRSRVNLSALKNVARLDIDVDFLYPWKTRRAAWKRKGACACLPPALLKLKIFVCYCISLDENSPNQHAIGYREHIAPSKHRNYTLNWLLDIAEEKPKFLPNLSSIYVGENKAIKIIDLPSIRYVPPDDFGRVFQNNGIDLEMCFQDITSSLTPEPLSG